MHLNPFKSLNHNDLKLITRNNVDLKPINPHQLKIEIKVSTIETDQTSLQKRLEKLRKDLNATLNNYRNI